MNEVFSTPSYKRMMESQAQQLQKLENNDIDVFVRLLAQKNNEPMEVKMPCSIGLKPEVVQEVTQTRNRIHQKHVADSYNQGFLGGLMFAGMLVLMVLMVLFMP